MVTEGLEVDAASELAMQRAGPFQYGESADIRYHVWCFTFWYGELADIRYG